MDNMKYKEAVIFPLIQVSYKLAKSLENNGKGIHFLMNMQARSALSRIFVNSFLYNYFLEQLRMGCDHWDGKFFTFAYQNNLLPFSFFFAIGLLLICVSLIFVHFSCQTYPQCILKIISMFPQVSKWSGDEAAIICIKSLL